MPLATGSSESVLVTVRSGEVGVAVGVNVAVGVAVLVGVAVFVGVNVNVGVGVAVAVGVAVLVGVDVNVGVAVAVNVGVCVEVAVAVAVGVLVFVAVGVIVGVLVAVGVGVGARTPVVSMAVLFDSSDSAIVLAGSTVAVFVTVSSMALVRKPVIVIVANAAGPVPREPRSHSSVPPVVPPTIAQLPWVVVNPTCVKFAGGVSVRLMKSAPAEPMFLTSMV